MGSANVTAEEIRLRPSAPIPNSSLPVLVHRGALAASAGAAAHAALFARHGWTNAWRDGVYPFHHYHSTSHEVLGVCGGRATLRLGGEGGRDIDVRAGDILVLPAGTGHCRIAASPDFAVVGAYPDGRDWDLIRADTAGEEVLRRAEANIAALPTPRQDPATGQTMEAWRTPS